MRSAAWGVGLASLSSVLGAPPSRPLSGAGATGWVKELAAAQKRARSQMKRVTRSLTLGDLPDLHCCGVGQIGKDLTPVARVMNHVEPLLRQGRWREAEAVLDRGLRFLGDTPPATPSRTP